MSFWQALAYFLSEALTGLRRSWKVSLLAILTISVSLFTGGAFMLVSGNLARIVEEWRRDAKIVVYLAPEAGDEDLARLSRIAVAEPWVEQVDRISRTEAERRFAAVFPSLASLLTGWEEAPLPPSLEISYDGAAVSNAAIESWLDRLAADSGVQMVDDDRQWLQQLGVLIVLARAVGLALGGILLAAAIFTIASVVRLTAYLHREEISVMRLVGATEFFIRGPFIAGGLIQGLLGGGMALAGLLAAFELGGARNLPTLLGSTLFGNFLSLPQLLALLALGGLAGVLGATLSLRREMSGSAASS